MDAPLRMWLTLSRSCCSEAPHRYFAFSRFFLDSFVPAGRSLLQGVQAEIRLLQEEVKETGKKRFGVLGFFAWETKTDLVKMSRGLSSRWLQANLH